VIARDPLPLFPLSTRPIYYESCTRSPPRRGGRQGLRGFERHAIPFTFPSLSYSPPLLVFFLHLWFFFKPDQDSLVFSISQSWFPALKILFPPSGLGTSFLGPRCERTHEYHLLVFATYGSLPFDPTAWVGPLRTVKYILTCSPDPVHVLYSSPPIGDRKFERAPTSLASDERRPPTIRTGYYQRARYKSGSLVCRGS